MTALFSLICPQSNSAPASMEQALIDFQAKRYSQALSGFQNVSRSNQRDPLCHYYLALCYQNMNQIALSSKEYQWVAANSRDPKIRSQAQVGLAQMQHYQSARQTQLASASASSVRSAAAPQISAPAKGAVQFSQGKMKVLEFFTQWCHVCKIFDPVFDQVQSSSKYAATCKFQRYDAEDPSNSDLVQRYEVSHYPTVIFADSNGKQIDRFAGSTNAASFGALIDRALVQLPK